MSIQESSPSRRSAMRELLSLGGIKMSGKEFDKARHEAHIRRQKGTSAFVTRVNTEGQTEIIDRTLVKEGY